MEHKQLYAQAIKYLISRGYTVEHNRTSITTKAYPKDGNLCTLAVAYWGSYIEDDVVVMKTDAYLEDCHDVEALLLMGCRLSKSILKSTVVEMKPAESYIPTWIRDLF